MNQTGFLDFKEYKWTELDVENLPEEVQLQQKKVGGALLFLVTFGCMKQIQFGTKTYVKEKLLSFELARQYSFGLLL